MRASQQGRSGLSMGRAVGEGGGDSSVGAKDRGLSYSSNGCTYTRAPEVILGRGAVESREWEVAVEGDCNALARDAHQTATR